MATIACVDLDPLVESLVRRVRPSDTVVDVVLDDLLGGRRGRYAAVVMTADAGSLQRLVGTGLLPRTVVVAQARDDVDVLDHPGPVVRRPVDPTELRLALGRVAPSGRLARLRRRTEFATSSSTTDFVFGVSRVAAVAAASGLALSNPLDPAPGLLVIALAAWSLLRVWARQSSINLVALDVLLTLVAVLLTGGTDSPFLLLSTVVAAEVGYTFRASTGATVVGSATAVGLVPLVQELARGAAEPLDLIAWGTLMPVASGIGVLAASMRRSRDTGALHALNELHATLDRLARQAQGVAGTLELNSVAERVMTSLRQDLGALAGVLLVGDAPIRSVVAAWGLADAAPTRLLVPEGRLADVPQALTALLPAGDQLYAPLVVSGVDRGGVLAVVPRGGGGRHVEEQVRAVAREAALAVENARLFEGIRAMTVDGERRRIARDLHDGVIQSLVHVGFELDLVSRTLADDAAADVARLREVVGQTVDEVRATVNDLRSVRLSSGLGAALQALAREYQRDGMRIVTDVAPVDDLPPEAEMQLFRIVQEAISNAVHHGRPRTIVVRLWEGDDELHLQVLDDGVGIDTTSEDDTVDHERGVGLRAMQERVDLLGARLDLGPRDGGGTCLQVDVPRERTLS